jgi:hypothetical protein
MGAILAALLSGCLFGAGLALAGMVDPGKVLGFLDFAGRWDPSLALVLAGATGTTFLAYRLIFRRHAPLLAPAFSLPAATTIDRSLLLGAALFGIGWGLVGLCPGPAIAVLAYGSMRAVIFVAAMLAGFVVAPVLARALSRDDG